jgi:hypothetical protein
LRRRSGRNSRRIRSPLGRRSTCDRRSGPSRGRSPSTHSELERGRSYRRTAPCRHARVCADRTRCACGGWGLMAKSPCRDAQDVDVYLRRAADARASPTAGGGRALAHPQGDLDDRRWAVPTPDRVVALGHLRRFPYAVVPVGSARSGSRSRSSPASLWSARARLSAARFPRASLPDFSTRRRTRSSAVRCSSRRSTVEGHDLRADRWRARPRRVLGRARATASDQ